MCLKDETLGRNTSALIIKMATVLGNDIDNEEEKMPGLFCYLCGKKFGTSSLDIHLKQCKKKWEDSESKKSKDERKPLPFPPSKIDEVLKNAAKLTQAQTDEYNKEALKVWK